MGRQVERRVRLPADHQSPLLARGAVRSVLQDAGLERLMEDAVLLASELCENAVLHAGTEFELHISASETELTVRVIDHGSTAMELQPAKPAAPTERTATHGRGLLLVDLLATAWGTRHDAGGHGVWFTLTLDPPGAPTDRGDAEVIGRPLLAPELGPGLDWPAPSAARWLLHLGIDRAAEVGLTPLVSELVRRLCDVLGADGVGVWVNYGDGSGEQQLAGHGRPPDAGSRTVALPLTAPLSGRLAVRTRRGGPSTGELAELTALRVALAVELDWLRGLNRSATGK